MLTMPIPERAGPVVRAIRRDIARPEDNPLPGDSSRSCMLRFPGDRCPMGLHIDALHETPTTSLEFGAYYNGSLCVESSVDLFYSWWDEQTDAQAATDAVWGPE